MPSSDAIFVLIAFGAVYASVNICFPLTDYSMLLRHVASAQEVSLVSTVPLSVCFKLRQRKEV